MVDSIWSLVPPLLAIIMVLITKRVLLSLGVGIVAAAFFIASFQISESLLLIWESFRDVFVEEGGLNTWNVFILLFVLLLGIITALISMMGGTRAFADWMIKRVKTRAGAQLMTMILGIVIFVDDYFNSLTVGQIAKPVTDKHRVSRAKLAYIVDSTSAPICVFAPVSSWGAYIIGLIGAVFATHGVTTHSALGGFLAMIPMNYYVWSALGVVLVIALTNREYGPMKVHEDRAIQTGQVLDPETKEQVNAEEKLPESKGGRVGDLAIPIIFLVVGVLGSIYVSGYLAAGDDKSFIQIFGEADVALALLCGGIIGLIVTLLLFSRHLKAGELTGKQLGAGFKEGAKSMLPAFAILIFAWSISSLIGLLGTGAYLAALVQSSNLWIGLLPVLVFIVAGFIAFATGTSWGSFALLLPIAGQIAAATEVELILPMLAAVLAGAVFGDHCSPISDTTILSSTGSSCPHIDHVTTQLPYAFTAAFITALGYLAFGLVGHVWVGLIVVVISLVVLFLYLKRTPETLAAEETQPKAGEL